MSSERWLDSFARRLASAPVAAVVSLLLQIAWWLHWMGAGFERSSTRGQCEQPYNDRQKQPLRRGVEPMAEIADVLLLVVDEFVKPVHDRLQGHLTLHR